MWVLAVFLVLANGEGGLELLPMESRSHCVAMLERGRVAFAKDRDVRTYYLECKLLPRT